LQGFRDDGASCPVCEHAVKSHLTKDEIEGGNFSDFIKTETNVKSDAVDNGENDDDEEEEGDNEEEDEGMDEAAELEEEEEIEENDESDDTAQMASPKEKTARQKKDADKERKKRREEMNDTPEFWSRDNRVRIAKGIVKGHFKVLEKMVFDMPPIEPLMRTFIYNNARLAPLVQCTSFSSSLQSALCNNFW